MIKIMQILSGGATRTVVNPEPSRLGEINEIFSAIQGETFTKIGAAIKSIFQAHGVKEVVLASPVRPDFALSDYAEGFDLEGIEPDVNAAEVEEWWMPQWLYDYNDSILELVKDVRAPGDDFPHGVRDSTLLVRLGIVDGEVKYTKQPKWFDEISWDSGEELESDWLPIASIPNLAFWRELLKALTEVKDVWTYTSQYPNLHKLK